MTTIPFPIIIHDYFFFHSTQSGLFPCSGTLFDIFMLNHSRYFVCGLKPKDYIIGICCFSAKHTAF